MKFCNQDFVAHGVVLGHFLGDVHLHLSPLSGSMNVQVTCQLTFGTWGACNLNLNHKTGMSMNISHEGAGKKAALGGVCVCVSI